MMPPNPYYQQPNPYQMPYQQGAPFEPQYTSMPNTNMMPMDNNMPPLVQGEEDCGCGGESRLYSPQPGGRNMRILYIINQLNLHMHHSQERCIINQIHQMYLESPFQKKRPKKKFKRREYFRLFACVLIKEMKGFYEVLENSQ